MKYEKLGTNYVKFTFTVKPDLFEQGLEEAFNEVKEDVQVKGFRKGKVPRNIYENKFGVESLYEKALNYVIGTFYPEILSEQAVVIVGEPKIDIDFAKVSQEEPFDINLTFPIKPEVKLGEYLGAEVEKQNAEVTDDEVEEQVNMLLQQNVQLEPKKGDTLEMDDTAIFDFEGFLEGVPFEGGKAENHQMKIGSKQFIPGFEEAMVGMKVGEEKELDITFPEEYHSEELKGKAVVFKVKLHEIKVESKKELNDDFVKSLNKENIETVADLKEDIKNNLKTQKETSEKNRIVGSAIKFAVDNAEVDIPVEMINYEKSLTRKQVEQQAQQYGIDFAMYLQFSGLTEEQFDLQISKQAQERVLTTLVIDAIAQKEDFAVTEEEINNKYDEIAQLYQVPLEEVKKQITDLDIKNEIKMNKAVDLLEQSVKQVNK